MVGFRSMRPADIARVRVHLGEHTLGVGENTEQFEKVTRVLYHRSFSHSTLHNDIALLKLESPARETQYIQPVCLSQDTRNLPDSTVTLAGWGELRIRMLADVREHTFYWMEFPRASPRWRPPGRHAPWSEHADVVPWGVQGQIWATSSSRSVKNTQPHLQNVHLYVKNVEKNVKCGSFPFPYRNNFIHGLCRESREGCMPGKLTCQFCQFKPTNGSFMQKLFHFNSRGIPAGLWRWGIPETFTSRLGSFLGGLVSWVTFGS